MYNSEIILQREIGERYRERIQRAERHYRLSHPTGQERPQPSALRVRLGEVLIAWGQHLLHRGTLTAGHRPTQLYGR